MTERHNNKLRIFMQFATDLSDLSTCKRAKVGCVVCDDRFTSVVSIGYNGQPAGLPHECCTGEEGSCGCVHAEANAIVKLSSARSHLLLLATTLPCWRCAGLIINSKKIKRVVYVSDYRDERSLELFRQSRVEVYRFNVEEL